MNKILTSLACLSIALGASSCDSKTEPQEFTAVGDVYIRSTIIDGHVKYAPIYYAYSNYQMSSVSVELPNTEPKSVSLEKYQDNSNTYRNIVQLSDYSIDEIENGLHTFTITSTKGESITTSDKLYDKRIAQIEITKFEYIKENHNFDIEWKAIEDVDLYVVSISKKKDGVLLFSNNGSKKTTYKFSQNSYEWPHDLKLIEGQEYTVNIVAYIFENSIINAYNIQMESIEYKTIVW